VTRETEQARSRGIFGQLAIVSAVLTVMLAADAVYMQLSGYHAQDRNGFGLTDAGTVVVAAGMLLVFTIALFVLYRRAKRVTR